MDNERRLQILEDLDNETNEAWTQEWREYLTPEELDFVAQEEARYCEGIQALCTSMLIRERLRQRFQPQEIEELTTIHDHCRLRLHPPLRPIFRCRHLAAYVSALRQLGDKAADRLGAARRRCAPKPAPDWKPERFARFWDYYPRGESKQAAIRAWDRLRPSDELISEMAVALGGGWPERYAAAPGSESPCPPRPSAWAPPQPRR